ncbi:unnamed protein product [Arctogadus glacialis]
MQSPHSPSPPATQHYTSIGKILTEFEQVRGHFNYSRFRQDEKRTKNSVIGGWNEDELELPSGKVFDSLRASQGAAEAKSSLARTWIISPSPQRAESQVKREQEGGFGYRERESLAGADGRRI